MHENKHGPVKRQKPTETELTEIQQLVNTCNAYERLHMRVAYTLLRARPGHETNDFLYYEGGKLVGYLALDSFGFDERELVGVVHPDFRRRGIFQTLLDAAKDECKQRGVQRLLLLCERSSASGQAFVHAIGAQLDHSEHELLLGTFQSRLTFNERLFIREAAHKDLDAVITVMASDFGDEKFARRFVTQVFSEPGQRFYLATLGGADLGCDEPIGTLRLDEQTDQVGMYSFVVRPEYRGQGYGRQLLEEVITNVQAESKKAISVEANVDNTSVLTLFQSCGFEIQWTSDYYRINIPPQN